MRAENPQCDFCGAEPYYSYPCRDFVVATEPLDDRRTVSHVSTGAWLACAFCSTYIEDDDFDRLYVERAIPALIRRGIPADIVRNTQSEIVSSWSAFASFRIGERVTFG